MLFPKLAQITTRDVISIDADKTLYNALEKMVAHNHRRIIVKKDDKYALFSSYDIIHYKSKKIDFNVQLKDIHLELVPCVNKNANILDTLDFVKNNFEIICVVDSDDSLYGVATSSDILASIDPHILLENTKIGDIFRDNRHYITASKEDNFEEILNILVAQGGDCILIIDEERKVEGIITSKDVNNAIYVNFDFSIPIKDFMTKDVKTLTTSCAVNDAIDFIQKQEFHRVVVVDEETKALVGLITQQDLISQSYVTWSKIVKEHFSEMEEIVNIFKNRNQKLTMLASTDALTGIYNRRMFTDLFEQNLALQIRHNYYTSLVMIDVDNFKSINDTYGHDVGDIVLKKITECLKNLLRTSDTFARWGGEEFIALLKYANIEDSFNVCEKLRQEIASLDISEVGPVTCSFGLTQVTNTDCIESAIKRADNALYKAKKEGKNRTIIL